MSNKETAQRAVRRLETDIDDIDRVHRKIPDPAFWRRRCALVWVRDAIAHKWSLRVAEHDGVPPAPEMCDWVDLVNIIANDSANR